MKNQKGQSLVEYVILVALVALVCVSSTKALGKKINGKIKDIKEHIDSGISVNLGSQEGEEGAGGGSSSELGQAIGQILGH